MELLLSPLLIPADDPFFHTNVTCLENSIIMRILISMTSFLYR